MTRVLVINSSPNRENSVSRDLTRQFVENWHRNDPTVEAVHRDVGMVPLPHLDQETINAYYTPPDTLTAEQQSALALSNQIVSEVEAAKVIVIGSPMHNFGISSGLKTWVDHLARVGRTFRYTENGPEGLLGGRRVFVLTARGGSYGEGSPAAAMDMQEPYLRTALGFVGLTELTFIHAEGIAGGMAGKESAEMKIIETVDAVAAIAA